MTPEIVIHRCRDFPQTSNGAILSFTGEPVSPPELHTTAVQDADAIFGVLRSHIPEATYKQLRRLIINTPLS